MTNPTTCNMTVDWVTGERCGKPADHTWTGTRGQDWDGTGGQVYHECPDHSTHTTTRCPCGDVPEVEVGPYTIRHGSGGYRTHTITVTETGEKIRTRSESPFLLICGGKIVARAYTTKTRDKWNRDWNAPVGLVVDMREGK